MCHNDFMKHLDENLDCPLHAITRYYLRFMVKNVDNWYKKSKDDEKDDVLFRADNAKNAKRRHCNRVKLRERLELKMV